MMLWCSWHVVVYMIVLIHSTCQAYTAHAIRC